MKSNLKIVDANRTNGAKEAISFSEPYSVKVEITGTADLLFHRWNCEEIEIKAASAKNSKAKKTDNIESYVWRNEDNEICIPGEYVRQAILHAAKFKQDPRSPRKSAMDLFKAGLVSETMLASLKTEKWDYEDKRRVTIQRNGINRVRPAMRSGWATQFQFNVLVPEYISPELLHDVLSMAGRLVGVGDFRPTYGRFAVTNFKVVELEK